MASLEEIRKIREKKLKNLRRLGVDPYPISTKRTHTIKEVLDNFSKLEKQKKVVVLVGRIRTIRKHGAITFVDVENGYGKIQAVFKKDALGKDDYQFFQDYFDIGDFIEVRGTLFKTKTKEKSILVEDYKLLAKSLRPLPEKWHGLKDIEERYRKRYLDLLFNPEIKMKFRLRSQIIKEIRNFLDKEDFIEVETPILQPIYGGATARPFKTHLNALNMDLYLRIAPELYLKRLLVGGFEKIYEIGKCFRNEGIDREHNPDFTILEFYIAYTDYNELMKFTERLLTEVIKKIFGTLIIKYQGKEINFTPPWQKIEFSDIFRKYINLKIEETKEDTLKEKAKNMGIKIPTCAKKSEIADEIYKKLCRPNIWQPTFILHYPIESKPLSKALDKDPRKSANFQLVAGGWELVNAFSELNDPLEQRRRFEEQEKLFKAGFEEAQRIDKDFLEALEYGMPPAAGFGMGIDRLVALLTNSHSLREVILFPTMRPR